MPVIQTMFGPTPDLQYMGVIDGREAYKDASGAVIAYDPSGQFLSYANGAWNGGGWMPETTRNVGGTQEWDESGTPYMANQTVERTALPGWEQLQPAARDYWQAWGVANDRDRDWFTGDFLPWAATAAGAYGGLTALGNTALGQSIGNYAAGTEAVGAPAAGGGNFWGNVSLNGAPSEFSLAGSPNYSLTNAAQGAGSFGNVGTLASGLGTAASLAGAAGGAGTAAGAAAGATGAGGLLSGMSGLSGLGALAGGALGAIGGGSKPAGTVTTVEDIPEWQKALIMPALQNASGLLQQQQGQSYPLLQPAQDMMQSTIRGDFLDPSSNPWLRSTYDQAASAVTDHYNSAVRPQNDAMFYKAGAFGPGSSTFEETVARNQFGLGQNLKNLGTDIYGGNYQTERQRQFGAGVAAPDFSQASAATPWAPYKNFMSVAGGKFGGSQSSPYFTNPVGGALSGAMTGGVLGNLFSKGL